MELMTITEQGSGAPTLAEAAKQLGVAESDLDATFGVVPIDPARGMYAVQVRTDKLPKRSGQGESDYRGPWSNPKIEPFGPVQDSKSKPQSR
jgi:hypothetical protein